MTELSEQQRQLKDAFIAARGYWNEMWDGILQLSPAYFEAYLNLSSVPWRTGTLPAKIKELLYVAIDASTTHLYAPGTRIHMRNALGHGATSAEIMEVLEITSVLGIHTMSMGVPALISELKDTGREDQIPHGPLSAEQERIKAEFTMHRGYWNPVWEQVLRFSPEFFEAYTQLSSAPWKHGTLEPKVKEFVYIAIDAATTHLYEPGLRVHIRNALGHGASAAEIMEVLMLTSVLGVHTMTMGVPALLDELAAAKQD